ncbi:MAG: 16S rRNA (guanine(527)-N(7))-methyltransferase RsmG [Rhizobiales bacterium]|nr:16S rRNA (guanine(527)-N(7))-methyltransferase RsmG [Hyphomicrobiales bacterium]
MPASTTKPDLTADRAEALRLTPVSRETLARLDRFVEILLTWNAKTNLIAASTIPHLWTRHISDSLQLLDLAPDARIWVDLGSGAGFPGVAIACALSDTPASKVHLIESNSKKAAFLREAVRLTGAPAIVHAERIEKFVKVFSGPADVVTARALAPLKQLLDQSVSLLKTGALGLFPKGQDVDAELTEATKYWNIKVNLAPSRTDSKSHIVVVRGLERRAAAADDGRKPARDG